MLVSALCLSRSQLAAQFDFVFEREGQLQNCGMTALRYGLRPTQRLLSNRRTPKCFGNHRQQQESSWVNVIWWLLFLIGQQTWFSAINMSNAYIRER